jgi:hypothetical protein
VPPPLQWQLRVAPISLHSFFVGTGRPLLGELAVSATVCCLRLVEPYSQSLVVPDMKQYFPLHYTLRSSLLEHLFASMGTVADVRTLPAAVFALVLQTPRPTVTCPTVLVLAVVDLFVGG